MAWLKARLFVPVPNGDAMRSNVETALHALNMTISSWVWGLKTVQISASSSQEAN
jgi:hypothetical protein